MKQIFSLLNRKLLVIISSMVAFLAMANVGSFAQAPNRSDKIIEYVIFDSLEHLLCDEISLMKQKDRDSICILINPYPDGYKSNIRYKYNIGIYYPYAYQSDSSFFISNRKMRICNVLYPVFFPRIDDVFCVEESERNKPFRYADIPEKLNIYLNCFFEVDMRKKKVLLSTFPDKRIPR